MTLYNTTDLKSPSKVPKIFHDLRFSHIGSKISADDDDSESADEEIGSSPDQTIEPDVKLIMEDDIKKVTLKKRSNTCRVSPPKKKDAILLKVLFYYFTFLSSLSYILSKGIFFRNPCV